MLYRLEIENFYSVRAPQVLDLTIPPNVPDHDSRYLPIFKGSVLRAPKVVAVYGANASGKTTVLRALQFLCSFIANSASAVNDRHSRPDKSLRVFPFNSPDTSAKPVRLAVEFGSVMNPDWEQRNERPEYGLLRYSLAFVAKDGVVDHVVQEHLHQKPEGKGRWVRVFERETGGAILGSDTFKMSGFSQLINTLRPSASLISTFAFFTHPTAGLYRELAEKMWTNLDVVPEFLKGDLSLMAYLNQQPGMLERLNRDLSRIDLGIEALRIENIPNFGPIGRFRHFGLGEELPWDLESQGTQAFVRLFPTLALALEWGGLALVDEFDTLIHPLVLPEILRWFYDDDIRNRRGGQIFMSCHSATLLEYLAKEEVVIAEKNSSGCTTIYSLMDVGSNSDKTVRRSDNLYKKYLGGVYGGVPVIG